MSNTLGQVILKCQGFNEKLTNSKLNFSFTQKFANLWLTRNQQSHLQNKGLIYRLQNSLVDASDNLKQSLLPSFSDQEYQPLALVKTTLLF